MKKLLKGILIAVAVIVGIVAADFPGQHIIDYLNLPFEDQEEFLPFCVWQKEAQVHLKENI